MRHRLTILGLLVSVLAGCASTQRAPAPVEDRAGVGSPPRSRSPATLSAGGVAGAPVEVRALPGAENAGRPGYYTVKSGDTLVRIALDAGQNWRDLARWNNLGNPNLIEVGQVLRVLPPPGEAVTTRAVPAPASTPGPAPAPGAPTVATPAAAAVGASGVTAAPVTASAVQAQAMPPVGAASVAPAASAASAPAAARAPDTVSVQAAPPSEDELAWAWPTATPGPVIATFDEVRNKGLDIGGKAGDPVLAAADGRVVYAGAGLRGYGNLVILKHNNTYLSAYAHNQTLLVREDQTVRKGQKIAEMGATDADRVKLHFEIRRLGKPVDPARMLPTR